MPAFGASSRAQLATCHEDLQRLFEEVVKEYDCKVIEGFRGKDAQNYAYEHGYSDVKWPNGNHNRQPSIAADVYPFPIEKNLNSTIALKRFCHFAGYVYATAERLGIKVVWGGDWDDDFDFTDQRLHDLPHFELVGPRGSRRGLRAGSRRRVKC